MSKKAKTGVLFSVKRMWLDGRSREEISKANNITVTEVDWYMMKVIKMMKRHKTDQDYKRGILFGHKKVSYWQSEADLFDQLSYNETIPEIELRLLGFTI